MPQDIHVVRCFNCETFQCDIVKKVPKWTCKRCNEKQSLQKVYFNGTGKECRKVTQELNLQRYERQSNETEVKEETPEEKNPLEFDDFKDLQPEVKLEEDQAVKTSKWDEFLSEDENSLDNIIQTDENDKKDVVLQPKVKDIGEIPPSKRQKLENSDEFQVKDEELPRSAILDYEKSSFEDVNEDISHLPDI